MSEYQYYEFRTIDHCLTDEEMDELRSFSTRAEITPNCFINDYSWGSFKGDEDRWMDEYFDAFLYYANWGTHSLKLRIPSKLLDIETAKAYCDGEYTSARISNDKIILDFNSGNEEIDEWDEDFQLGPFLSLRNDLIHGDLRCLYLAWLSEKQSDIYEEFYDENEIEPPVPPGLAQLSPALIYFANFLRINSNLIEAASENSASLDDFVFNINDYRLWIRTFKEDEKINLLIEILDGSLKGDHTASIKLSHRFKQAQLSHQTSIPRRTITQLLKKAEVRTDTLPG